MNTLYLDASAGIAGNMAVGCLLDLGGNRDLLLDVLKSVPFEGGQPRLIIEKTSRRGMDATYCNTLMPDTDSASSGHHHTTLDYICGLMEASAATERARKMALKIFRRLFEAEATVHGATPETVHLHEAGGQDAVFDILGFAVLADELKITSFFVSPINTGSGHVKCAHGLIPVPAPATALLLKGYHVFCPPGLAGEFATPTGAAILAGASASSGMPPDFSFHHIGAGAGTMDPEFPNILRGFLSERRIDRPHDATDNGNDKNMTCFKSQEFVSLLSTRLDDATGEIVSLAAASLIEKGALDVWITPHTGRKGRPGMEFSLLCTPENADRLENQMFFQLPTLGIRHQLIKRSVLKRRSCSINHGHIQLKGKKSLLPDGTERIKPEIDSVAEQARNSDTPPLKLLEELAISGNARCVHDEA